jgi:hypothetical protein
MRAGETVRVNPMTSEQSPPLARAVRPVSPGRFAWLFLILLPFLACSALPDIKPSGPSGQPDFHERCRTPFPVHPYRFTHEIEARLPDGSRATALGVVGVDPVRRRIHAVVMTLEGFVLFDATSEREMTVNRAVPPFDAPELAEGLLGDIRFILLPPDGDLQAAGLLEKGLPVCRYRGKSGLNVDVIANPGWGWLVNEYDGSDHLSRQVRLYAFNVAGFPERIELVRHCPPSYGLKMTLLQAERLNTEDQNVMF